MAYHEVMQSESMRNVYQNYPLVYTLDDHDSGNNNANGNDVSTLNAVAAYNAVVPHHKISSKDEERGIWQSFTVA